MEDLFRSDYTGPGLAGVDEVGRGPLAGDVVAAAVILDPQRPVCGLQDSKKLSARRREELARLIRENALAWAVARATVTEIDELNILQASLLAMHRAVRALDPQPQYVLVDGNRLPRWEYPSEPVIRGDNRVPAIAAASILAKVQRDSELVALEQEYPGYGFAAHKGYPTPAHLRALQALGVTPVHRRSFAPVKNLLGGRLVPTTSGTSGVESAHGRFRSSAPAHRILPGRRPGSGQAPDQPGGRAGYARCGHYRRL